jgi:pimeloyl-ACP methyl ester carboxylesterase
VLENDARWLRARWTKSGVGSAAATQYLSVLGNEPAMTAALAWYRARGAVRAPLGVIRVPVLYVWGEADDTVGRVAAEGTRDFVSGPYRFESLAGVGHFVADQAPERVNKLLLAHLAAHPT